MALPVTFRSENYSLRFNEKNFSDVYTLRYVARRDSKLVIESDMAKAPNPPFSRVFVAKLVSLLTYLLAAAPHTSSYESSLLWLL